ncbi:cell division protein FtsW [Rhodanobacter sp. Root480]|uniref:Probable peptidoglycan glycosyltransferase FtsW n=1 Tax=Rhodanobacter ginsenosidimutans TaxID=490571 RepID=A0ABW0JSM0_9GAMM|nr:MULTISPECIES: putative lipid II flippase FtsW [unclassified Rhodanobacter]KQX97515.1 cell division protein FtsW [Rhodanobacter sp. Root480]KRA33306.1 cell division protein FtsW [Rhodanobacter sp. Root627]
MFDTTQAKRRHGPRGSFDLLLLVALIALASIGVVMVASSSISVADSQHLGAFYYLERHLVFLSLGLLVAGVAMRTEMKLLEKFAFPLLALAFVLLLAVFVPHLGMRINGARRWLNLLVTSFQPVEAVKLILVVYIASYLVRHRENVETRFLGLFKPVVVAGLIVLLLLAQPDFGSATLVIAVTIAMVWLGGARPIFLFLMGLPLMPLLYIAATGESYRMKRLTSFMDPWKDPFNDGFQLTQSLMAIGRGEWTGVGLGSSVLKLSYLPEAHTDFIFAVIGEELGLAGVVLVIGLFAMVVGRGLYLGLKGVEVGQRFAGYVAFGISLMLAMQAIVSVGVNLGALPTKGLTLPLISYGGSSMVLTCAMAGVLLRATFEINRALDARHMATRMPAAVTAVDANAAVTPREQVAA